MPIPPKVRILLLFIVAGGMVGYPLRVYARGRRFVGSKSAPKKGARKIRFLYKASEFYLTGATMLDMASTAQVIGHPTVARREDGSLLADYHGTENGWAAFLGKRDTDAVILANVGLNVGLGFLSRKLYRKGGHWRDLAIVVNFLKGTGNLVAGIHNIQYDAGIDGRVRALTGYGGQIIWSH